MFTVAYSAVRIRKMAAKRKEVKFAGLKQTFSRPLAFEALWPTNASAILCSLSSLLSSAAAYSSSFSVLVVYLFIYLLIYLANSCFKMVYIHMAYHHHHLYIITNSNVPLNCIPMNIAHGIRKLMLTFIELICYFSPCLYIFLSFCFVSCVFDEIKLYNIHLLRRLTS